MSEEPRRILLRIQRKRRLAILIWITVFMALFTFFIVKLILNFQGIGEYFGGLELLLVGSFVVELIVVLAIFGYVIAYWWTYRIVLDGGSIARLGVPHLLDRKVRIPYSEIERITHGTKYVIRIIPRQGRVLAINLKILDLPPNLLISELRQRIGADRVEADLEKSVFEQKKSGPAEWVFAAITIPMMIVVVGSSIFKDRILGQFAWERVLDEERAPFTVNASQDGTTWLLTEGLQRQSLLGLRLYHIQDEQIDWVDLPRDPVLQASLPPYDGFDWYVQNMAVYHAQQVWFLFRGEQALYAWDGVRWSRFEPQLDGELGISGDMVSMGDELWIMSSPGMLYRYYPENGRTESFRLNEAKSETASEQDFSPTGIYSTLNGELIVTGIFTVYSKGFVVIQSNGIVDGVQVTDEIIPVQDVPRWDIQYAGTDAKGNIYVIYTSREDCYKGRCCVIVGRFAVESKDWRWVEIKSEKVSANASPPSSFAIDPRGRIWLKRSHGEGKGVTVYGEGVFETGMDGPPQTPYRQYTEQNSLYNGEDLIALSNGQIYALDWSGEDVVRIDASIADLPKPAPAWMAWVMDNTPYLLIPMLILVWVPIILTARKNYSRKVD